MSLTGILGKNSEREVLNQAIDAVVTIDHENCITFFNSAAESLWGYTADEVMGKNVRLLVPPEIREPHDSFVNLNRTSGINKIVGTSREVPVHRKDGEVLWGALSLSKVVVRGKIQYTAFVRDITESKNQQEIINQTLMQALDAVVTIDENNIVSFFNPAAERLWGYKPEEVVGKNVAMLVPPEHQGNHDNYVHQNRKTGVDKIVGTHREVPFFTKDGEQRWASLSLSKVDLGGRILYTAFLKDVTAEVQQRDKFKLLSLVADETDNSVVIAGPDRCIQYVNPGFTKLTGYTSEEAIGQSPGALLQGKDTNPETVARISAKLAACEPFYEEILNYSKDKTPYWISLAINPVFDEQGELVHFVSIQANVTDTKVSSLEFNYKLDAISRISVAVDFDLNGHLTDANEKCLEAFQCDDLRSLRNCSFSKLDQDVLHRCSLGEPVSGEFSYQAPNGEEVWLDGAYSPIFDSFGEVSKVSFFAQVATQRNQVIDRVSKVLERLAQGDLTGRAVGEFGKDFNVLRDNLNASMQKLQDTLQAVGKASGEISSNSQAISAGNDNLSSRTESQASSLQETAATMEELTATVNQTSENASQASNLAGAAKTTAEGGGEVVRNAIEAMTEILTASNKINDIISVIDEIAAQTNLLALNAAVEAARAGEQGLGFAVVADEVRVLAKRSADAAMEVKSLIRDTVEKVEWGSKLVNQSGETLAEIITAVDQAAGMIEEVASASNEQRSGITQINAAISQIDQVTQQNAVLVEETGTLSKSMLQNVSQMGDLVSFFSFHAQAGTPKLELAGGTAFDGSESGSSQAQRAAGFVS